MDAATSTAVTSFTWQGRGRKAGATHQNGTSAEYAYDGFRRLAAIDHLLSGGTTLHQLDYAYDKVHNRQMEQYSFDATWVGGLPTAIQAVGRNPGKEPTWRAGRAALKCRNSLR